ncbi:MAG: hypothetical protein LH645_07570 [Actinomycetia bacterium]|nr:hypothetical protein [Actinomycetes bacterium]
MLDFHWNNYHLDRAVSVAQVIRMWASIIEQGWCRIEAQKAGLEWVTDSKAIPLFIRRTDLI